MTHLPVNTTELGSGERTPTNDRRRRLTAAAGVAALAASMGVGALGSAAEAASAPALATRRAAPASAFTAVRSLGTISATGTPVAMTAPGGGVVYVLSEGKDRKAEVLRVTTRTNRGKTTTSATHYRLGTELGDPGKATIDGTSTNDVWVTANGGLWRFTGRGFSRVALPRGESAVTVADAPGSGVYVGTASTKDGGEVFRGTVGRRGVSWKSVGYAAREGFENWGLPVLALRVTDGKVFGIWEQAYSANIGRAVYELDSNTWTMRYMANTLHPSGGVTAYTWLTPKASEHVVLGRADSPRGEEFSALTTTLWKGGEAQQCLRGTPQEFVSEKGTLLADGRLVTDGFRVSLDACNRPRPVGGDAGDGSLAMTTERGTNTAWAITKKGDSVTLQRFTG